MFKTHIYIRVIIVILMITTYLPVVYFRFPSYIGSHHFWVVIWGVSLLIFKPKVLIDKMMITTYIYGLFIWLMLNYVWINMNEWNATMLPNEYYQILIGISIITYFNVSKDYKGLALITKYALIFIIITAFMTIITSFIDPMYARYMFVKTSEGEASRILINKFGAGTYGTVLAFMGLIPILIYYFKNNKHFLIKKKVTVFAIILLISFAIIRMQIFTNILVGLVFSIFAFLSVEKRLFPKLIIGLTFIVFTIIPNYVYINLLYDLSNVFYKMQEVSFKFKEVALYIQTAGAIDENAVTGRVERLPILINAFLESPVLGNFYNTNYLGYGYHKECYHLYWMNKLTITGLIGFTLFLLIILKFINNERKIIKGEFRSYFMLGLISIIVYGLFKSVAGRECWYMFFVIIPGMYYLPLSYKNANITKIENKIEDK